ncbi:phosphatidylinositol-glycan biosynthesis class S protein-domain-containing protein [Hysterangium stoloniferum]|nr:phosphatidylinositol-glycan biosynthesis class S protein-domain-containing protein [Hysterangium stoloniferum]
MTVDSVDLKVPQVTFQSSTLKFRIILSYWIVILLGLPLWWFTTSIDRLALPVDRVLSISATSELQFPLEVVVDAESAAEGTVKRIQSAIEHDKHKSEAPWLGMNVQVHEKAGSIHNTGQNAIYTIKLHPQLDALDGSALCELLAPYKRPHKGRSSQERLVARYSSKFRLAFSLLNEDASAGDSVVGWDIESAIDQYLSPVLSQLTILHNFTIESQVQFHAPLAFDPPEAVSPSGEPEFTLSEEELKIFINSADWTLASSVTEDPVLHFILFVPSAARRPLVVRSNTGSQKQSFIVPQWGSVVILDPSLFRSRQTRLHLTDNDLAGIFKTFRAQLLTLLGVSSVPPSVSVKSHQVSEWQLDALLRKRTLENIHDSKEALSSIVTLVSQIGNMPVGQDVKGDIQDALDAIDQVYSDASESPRIALQRSANANVLSSRAFFNPGMLALLYFPAEHKYAVYIPLFGPVTLPLVVALIKQLKRWWQQRSSMRQKVE